MDIFLLPEISKDLTESLLQFIDFECGIRDIEDYLNSVEDGKYDLFKDVLEPIENLSHKFDQIWAVLKTLYLADSSVMPARIYYPIHNKACMSHTTKYNSKPIYEACKKADLSKLTEEQVAVVNKFIKEGKLNGLELSEKLDYSFKANKQKCSAKQKYFKIRLEMAWSQFQQIIDNPQLVKDFPEDLLTLMALNKNNPKKRPWKVALTWGTADRFIEYCPDRDLRWNVWQAYEKAGSPADEKRELNNGLEVEEIRKLRLEAAEKLGFKNYGELSLITKMAPSISVIENTLLTILDKARPLQDKEIESLQNFSNKKGNEYPIQMWDVSYWARLQKKELFGYDEVQWSEYFPLDRVLDGLFELCRRLYGIRILEMPNRADVWHPDVKYYEIIHENDPSIVAGFYLDLCSRPQKMKAVGEPGWLVTHRPASSIPKKVLPLTALIMNFPSMQNKNPSLLSFDQVKTLFGKFGHLLQNVLCQVHYAEVSGLSNVEWDAVGITSNFMIHWLYDKDTFDSINSHYKTGKRLPNDQLTEMKQHMAGFNTCDELYKSMIDIKMHTIKTNWNDLVKEMWSNYYGFPLSKWNSFPCRFAEVMSNEQGAASYYSGLWSRIIAADVFQSFKAPDETTKNLGNNFRDTFFAFGGSCPSGEIFRRFKGRDPNPEAFISDLGLDKDDSN
ncbi:unnamed protein product [Macrosiphum euphorbiae]|uniref:oligopeptidase A n=1 Tax=Macrosiphum euphorbiae TaxID=13131 RepID=A0AAV0XE47_9HEMI|nr:unnamed protein product [Macrosiphum euphorbiae]